MKIKKNWIACVQDRGKWKEVVEKAKTFNQEVQRLEEEKEEEEENICVANTNNTIFFYQNPQPATYFDHVNPQATNVIYMEHPFLMFLDHTQRPTTDGRTPLDE